MRKSRWTSWAPVPNNPTVSVDVKQHFSHRPRVLFSLLMLCLAACRLPKGADLPENRRSVQLFRKPRRHWQHVVSACYTYYTNTERHPVARFTCNCSAMQKLRPSSVENRELTNVFPLMPGVSQNIATIRPKFRCERGVLRTCVVCVYMSCVPFFFSPSLFCFGVI